MRKNKKISCKIKCLCAELFYFKYLSILFMAVPKKKTSKSRRGHRRSHQNVKAMNIVVNKETGVASLPGQIALDGTYNGKQVIAPKVQKQSSND